MGNHAATVLARIDPEIRATFNDRQIEAIARAVDGKRLSGRRLEARGTLSLYFVAYFFVLQAGRDRRRGRQRVEHERRENARLASNVVFFLLAMSPVVLLVIVGMYFLKAALGIDIFPDLHMPNLLGLGRR
jgi:hypothetical protein